MYMLIQITPKLLNIWQCRSDTDIVLWHFTDAEKVRRFPKWCELADFFVQKQEIFFLQIGCQMATEDKVSVIDEMQSARSDRNAAQRQEQMTLP